MMPALMCDGLHASYNGAEATGSNAVLRGVSFSLAHGEMVVIVGPNGGGKTTLIRALSGVLAPTQGRVLLGGQPVAGLSGRERARRVAVVSQRASVPECTVREAVLMGRYARLSWHAVYGPSDYRVVEEAMEQTSIRHLAERQADSLSGGEWQRVLLARAFAQDTAVLLLDEPATGLDPGRVVDVFDLLEARRADGAAVLAVLHDINLAALYATRLIGLCGGHIVFDGPPAAVLTPEHLDELYALRAEIFSHPVTGAPQLCWTPGFARTSAPACDPALPHACGKSGGSCGNAD